MDEKKEGTMYDELSFLHSQISDLERTRDFLQERKATYASAQDIPAQLRSNEQALEQKIAWYRARVATLSPGRPTQAISNSGDAQVAAVAAAATNVAAHASLPSAERGIIHPGAAAAAQSSDERVGQDNSKREMLIWIAVVGVVLVIVFIMVVVGSVPAG
jgi:phage shock protein A